MTDFSLSTRTIAPVTSERYTGQMRWRRNFIGFEEASPVLQQAVEVTEHVWGSATSQRIEWRDVPTVLQE